MASTILELFEAQVRAGGHRPALRSKRGGRWTTTTWEEWDSKSRAIAAALLEAGVEKGDRVAILSNTREEWVVADLAILMSGAITVPVYPTLTAEETRAILEDSGAVAVFVDTPQVVEKLVPPAVEARASGLRRIVAFEEQVVRDIPQEGDRRLTAEQAARTSDVPVEVLASLIRRGEVLLEDQAKQDALGERVRSVVAEDLASIAYTASCGRYRGAMLSHRNFCFQVAALCEPLDLTSQDEQLLFLPLAHILGKMMFLIQLQVGCTTSFAENMLRAIDNACEIHPTFLGAVPRLFEKFYGVANAKAGDEGHVRQRLFHWAIDVGRRMARARRRGRAPEIAIQAQHRYAEKLVLSKLRARFGGRLRFAISGGAPLGAELAEWFDAIGVTVLEAYGLTETCGASNINRPSRLKYGTVGPPLGGMENRIAPEGEILLRGRGVMKGYWGDPGATAEVLEQGGWLHTGDIGVIDVAGMLRITDRKKDLIVTLSGKSVAPQGIENLLGESPWIEQCIVVGEQREYLAALLTLNRRALSTWASENGRPQEIEKLAADPEVRALLQIDIDSVNHRLAEAEAIRKFAILPKGLSAAADELTATGRVRRAVVTKRYAELIDRMYDEGVD